MVWRSSVAKLAGKRGPKRAIRVVRLTAVYNPVYTIIRGVRGCNARCNSCAVALGFQEYTRGKSALWSDPGRAPALCSLHGSSIRP